VCSEIYRQQLRERCITTPLQEFWHIKECVLIDIEVASKRELVYYSLTGILAQKGICAVGYIGSK
jgi:hypothetical protein